MKRIILFTTTLFVLNITSAQDKLLGISFEPSLQHGIFKSNSSSKDLSWLNHKYKWGYSTRITFEKKILKKFSLTSGIIFANKGYQTEKSKSLNFNSQILPRDGFTPPSSTTYTDSRLKYNQYIVGLPICLNYFITYKKARFFASLGVAINYIVNVKQKTIFYNGDEKVEVRKKDNSDRYKNVSFSTNAQVGVEFDMSKNYAMRVFPNFSQTLTNVINNGENYRLYPNMLGLGFGIYRKL